ncbi:MAG TPA: tRNA (adenosine(37)-N6)-threonylcarbamoyltransferase complex dimerization subunit type 1 TsaB [Gammaproteobacteria bacterium]|nr:tRNA (adenosine(37)-N6)-threonylcarbamoyltransferase complex dimerization subunit type 1 TsaB [Gammaproteobacteria bacterium]
MKLLAIDTATEFCSVALFMDSAMIERAVREPRAHADNVLPFVAELLAEADLSLAALDGIAFGRGPGGFTGLRVAAAVTQGLALGADLPVVGISDLAALAYGAFTTHGWRAVAASLDARMGEIYFGVYRCGEAGMEVVAEDALAPPGEVTLAGVDGAWHGAGPGWEAHWSALPEATRSALTEIDHGPPQARAVAELGAIELAAGRGAAPESAIPVYLRDKVAEKRSA